MGHPPRGLSRRGLGTTRGPDGIPGQGGLEKSHGSPAALARLLFALCWGGVIFKVTPEGRRLPARRGTAEKRVSGGGVSRDGGRGMLLAVSPDNRCARC